jgi:hypothetical protein
VVHVACMHVACMHERAEKCIQYLAGKPEKKRPLGKLSHRWKDDVSMGHK